ncbi:hypothetical protein [Rhodococcus chondri]|uniref:Integral membrane protein n=1 Tax=Rhodococcus chondri TaxID=3065941 RepID=A0ABU7JZ92_9NOCA|nr:hypothetical protein [Rhodococcus sp. CC-R104]MEE2035329.1 hypothetical protein [Rhodococcus sp. CC-R104]
MTAFLESLAVARGGDGGEARFFLILAGLMLLTALFGATYWWPHRGKPGVRHVERGGRGFTEVRSRISVFGLLVTMVGCAAALAIGAAVEVFLFNAGVPAVSLVLALLGLPCVLFVSEVLFGRIRPGGLLLGPDGIRVRGWTLEAYLPWVSVAGVRAVHHGFPEIWVEGTPEAAWARRRTSRLFRLDRMPDAPRLEVDSRRYAIDPVLLHRLLEFYALYPETRAELGTPRAVERVRGPDLADPR